MKTLAFAHNLISRELLRRVRFPGAPGPCLIKHEGRDIGGHFDTTLRGSGTTLNKRIQATTNQMNTTQAAFAGAAQRGALVRGKFIPKATYSADTTAFSQHSLDALSTAIVRFIHRQSKETARNKRSITLTLTTHQPKSGAANDPLHTIFQNRIMAARRAYHKQPPIALLMQELYNKYEQEQKPGTQVLGYNLSLIHI